MSLTGRKVSGLLSKFTAKLPSRSDDWKWNPAGVLLTTPSSGSFRISSSRPSSSGLASYVLRYPGLDEAGRFLVSWFDHAAMPEVPGLVKAAGSGNSMGAAAIINGCTHVLEGMRRSQSRDESDDSQPIAFGTVDGGHPPALTLVPAAASTQIGNGDSATAQVKLVQSQLVVLVVLTHVMDAVPVSAGDPMSFYASSSSAKMSGAAGTRGGGADASLQDTLEEGILLSLLPVLTDLNAKADKALAPYGPAIRYYVSEVFRLISRLDAKVLINTTITELSSLNDIPSLTTLLMYIRLGAADLSSFVAACSPLVPGLKRLKQPQLELTVSAIRVCIWNWVRAYPGEFDKLARSDASLAQSVSTANLDSMLESLAALAEKFKGARRTLWPVMSVSLLLAGDILHALVQVNAKKAALKTQTARTQLASAFLSSLKSTLHMKEKERAKNMDLLLSAARAEVDLVAAATYIDTNKAPNSNMRLLVAPMINEDLLDLLFNPGKPLRPRTASPDLDLLTDTLIAAFRLNPKLTIGALFPRCTSPEAPAAYKIAWARGLRIMLEQTTSVGGSTVQACYWHPALKPMEDDAGCLREALISSMPAIAATASGIGSHLEPLLTEILALYAAHPGLAYKNWPSGHQASMQEARALFGALVAGVTAHWAPALSHQASRALDALYHRNGVERWSPGKREQGVREMAAVVESRMGEALLQDRPLPVSEEQRHRWLVLLTAIVSRRSSLSKKSGDSGLEPVDKADRYSGDAGHARAAALLQSSLLVLLSSAHQELAAAAALVLKNMEDSSRVTTKMSYGKLEKELRKLPLSDPPSQDPLKAALAPSSEYKIPPFATMDGVDKKAAAAWSPSPARTAIVTWSKSWRKMTNPLFQATTHMLETWWTATEPLFHDSGRGKALNVVPLDGSKPSLAGKSTTSRATDGAKSSTSRASSSGSGSTGSKGKKESKKESKGGSMRRKLFSGGSTGSRRRGSARKSPVPSPSSSKAGTPSASTTSGMGSTTFGTPGLDNWCALLELIACATGHLTGPSGGGPSSSVESGTSASADAAATLARRIGVRVAAVIMSGPRPFSDLAASIWARCTSPAGSQVLGQAMTERLTVLANAATSKSSVASAHHAGIRARAVMAANVSSASASKALVAELSELSGDLDRVASQIAASMAEGSKGNTAVSVARSVLSRQ